MDAPSKSNSPHSHALRTICSFREYLWMRYTTSRGLVGSGDFGSRALWTLSNSMMDCGDARTLWKMVVTVSERFLEPVASGSPRSRRLFLRLLSSKFSKCSCNDAVDYACATLDCSEAPTLASREEIDVSPASTLSDRELISDLTACMSLR